MTIPTSSGTKAVGAMIVAGPAGFMKTHYRTFNIKGEDLTPGDDYGMMREVLRRRFVAPRQRAAQRPRPRRTASAPEADAFPQRPDLILIDGGKGQFDAARQILAELGVEGVAVASIAKGADRNAGRETFFVAGKPPFRLAPRDPALYFVQRLRDEAHRFAIGTHRARRKKDFTRSPLDEIAGIGPARKRALAARLRHGEGDFEGGAIRSREGRRRSMRRRPGWCMIIFTTAADKSVRSGVRPDNIAISPPRRRAY